MTPTDDREYCLALGQAIFAFAKLEYAVVCIIEKVKPGYISEYRATIKTAGTVATDFERTVYPPIPQFPAANADLIRDFKVRFHELIERRNKLLHANPATDHDGAQILIQQAFSGYIVWNWPEVLGARTAFESAGTTAAHILHEQLK